MDVKEHSSEMKSLEMSLNNTTAEAHVVIPSDAGLVLKFQEAVSLDEVVEFVERAVSWANKNIESEEKERFDNALERLEEAQEAYDRGEEVDGG